MPRIRSHTALPRGVSGRFNPHLAGTVATVVLALTAGMLALAGVARGDAGPARHARSARPAKVLLGNATIESQRDALIPGRSEAFGLRAHASGQIAVLQLYVRRAEHRHHGARWPLHQLRPRPGHVARNRLARLTAQERLEQRDARAQPADRRPSLLAHDPRRGRYAALPRQPAWALPQRRQHPHQPPRAAHRLERRSVPPPHALPDLSLRHRRLRAGAERPQRRPPDPDLRPKRPTGTRRAGHDQPPGGKSFEPKNTYANTIFTKKKEKKKRRKNCRHRPR